MRLREVRVEPERFLVVRNAGVPVTDALMGKAGLEVLEACLHLAVSDTRRREKLRNGRLEKRGLRPRPERQGGLDELAGAAELQGVGRPVQTPELAPRQGGGQATGDRVGE